MTPTIPDLFERGFNQAYQALRLAFEKARLTGQPADHRLQFRCPVRTADPLESYLFMQAFDYGVRFGIIAAKRDHGQDSTLLMVDTGLRFEEIRQPEPPEPSVAPEPMNLSPTDEAPTTKFAGFPWKVYMRDQPYQEWEFAGEAENEETARKMAGRLRSRAGKLVKVEREE